MILRHKIFLEITDVAVGRNALVGAIGLEPANFCIVADRVFEQFNARSLTLKDILDWKHHFHTAIQVSVHQIRTSEINLFIATVDEQEYPRVFEKASDDT